MGFLPKIWGFYRKYGVFTENMGFLPKIWGFYRKYGVFTENMGFLPKNHRISYHLNMSRKVSHLVYKIFNW